MENGKWLTCRERRRMMENYGLGHGYIVSTLHKAHLKAMDTRNKPCNIVHMTNASLDQGEKDRSTEEQALREIRRLCHVTDVRSLVCCSDMVSYSMLSEQGEAYCHRIAEACAQAIEGGASYQTVFRTASNKIHAILTLSDDEQRLLLDYFHGNLSDMIGSRYEQLLREKQEVAGAAQQAEAVTEGTRGKFTNLDIPV